MKWVLPDEKPGDSESLLDFILNQREIKDKKSFLYSTLENLHDPFLMWGMKNVAETILDAVNKKKKIVIHGDFDVDGVTATSIMWDFLYRKLGADVLPFIPNRFTDGYGLSDESMNQIKEMKADLIITVDCGIKDIEIVKKYHKDFDFVITDHHTILENKNDEKNKDVEVVGRHGISKYAKAVTHPGLDGSYPFTGICGAVVSLKVCIAINSLLGNKFDMSEYLPLAAMGTVCDIMPLVDENRAIVSEGLRLIKETNNIGLKALMRVSGVNPREVATYHIGFALGPRINAAGRIDHAMDAVRLLTTQSSSQANELASKLDMLNKQRQDLTHEYVDLALAQIDKKNKVHFIYGEDWPEGILGLIAGKITQKYFRPSLVASSNGDFIKGSARSIEGYNISKALKDLDKHLIRYGGHAEAAGFSLNHSALPEFKDALQKHAKKKLKDTVLEPILFIDAEINNSHLSLPMVEELNELAPFGQANAEPVVLFSPTETLRTITFGSENQHIKAFSPSSTLLEFIGFGKAYEFRELLESSTPVEIAGSIGTNIWNGNKKIQIKIRDIRKK
ncbi:single-stranded-DNA-specific exonuclease RecJ [Candidatus Dojkabacteria bacterium]|uniref:Single-stranded-DNA-specific exonuclease RecJ n=1 Tax=Candidatus Dojkabacteria bacterium TaxID=2099670 RepID=A0A955RLJ8_9BACT|nr:single-stranded-DNA-specific exonuclease RecJ [Candidatus Dojkabacteria bacterium]